MLALSKFVDWLFTVDQGLPRQVPAEPRLEGHAGSELNDPPIAVADRAVLPADHTEARRVQQIEARISPLHVIKKIERLTVDLNAHALGDAGILGEPEVQVPALLPADWTVVIASAIEADQVRPELTEDPVGILEHVHPDSAIRGVSVRRHTR